MLLIVMLSYQYYRLRAKCSESDQLMAGEFNSPVADACIAKMPAAARGKVAVAILGPATFGFALSPHQNIVGVGDQVLLAVDADENGLYVTSDLYTQDGALLAHVERTKFSAVGPLLCERPDLNTLSVRTW